MEATLAGDLHSIRAAGPADARLKGNRVEWIPTADPFSTWMPPSAPVVRALDALCALAIEPSGAKVFEFVKRYGVLEMTEGGAPACGLPGLSTSPGLAESWRGCAVSWEPIAGYVAYAESAAAFRGLAAALYRSSGQDDVDPYAVLAQLGVATDADGGHSTQIAAWQAIEEWTAASGMSRDEWISTLRPGRWGAILDYSSFGLAQLLWPRATSEPKRPPVAVMKQRLATYFQHRWIRPSGLVPRLDWSGDRPRFALGIEGMMGDAPPLFRVLALQLAAAITGAEKAFTCSHCGTVGYRQDRRPRTDQPAYCDDCRPKTGSIRQANYLRRKRAK